MFRLNRGWTMTTTTAMLFSNDEMTTMTMTDDSIDGWRER
jgi:hypothetical protein